jgi:glucose-1-phosphate thymidylyltransferase
MQAIILAGGFAKRLWPLTKNTAKPLLDVGGKPMIEYIMEKIENLDVDKIFISTNARFGDDFKKYLAKRGCKKPAEVVVEPTYGEDEKFGAIAGLHYVIDEKDIDDDVLVVSGDNLFEFDIEKFVDFFKNKMTTVIAVYDVEDEEIAKRMGIVTLDDEGKVVGFVEKPEEPSSTLTSIGCYIFAKKDLEMFGKYLNDKNNPDAPGYFVGWLIKQTPVFGFPISGKWFDVGDLKCLEDARKWIEEKKV